MALLLSVLMISFTLAGCLQGDAPITVPDEEPENDGRIFVTNGTGMPVDETPLEMNFTFSDVGETGKEPSIGITSSGCMFFIAMEKPMRSCDHGESWTNVADITQAPFTSDPYGWVDLETDRIFNIHMMGLESTWIGWSDTDGETWMGNPHDS